MNPHEVYPRPAVVVATVEVRHNAAPPLSSTERRRIKELIGNWAPIQRSSKEMTVPIVQGTVPASAASEEFPKFFARDSRLAISFKQGAVIVEATKYDGWLKFKAIIDAAVRARALVGLVDAVERVGIRYLNEVRPGDDHQDSVDWTQWVDAGLLGPMAYAGTVNLGLSQLQGLAAYGPQDGRSLVLRYTPGEGQAVESNQELIRLPGPTGPFMWLDIDSFWTPEGFIPEFDPAMLVEKSEELHEPLRTLFEKLITDRLRDEVLRRG